jgi:hypothetical protein
MTDDPRHAAARYRRRGGLEPDPSETPVTGAAERVAFVETSIQQAIRRGDFDDLPGAGRPLTGLGATHDPDWWIRRKIEREKLTGLGPPALLLRVEARELPERLDALAREDDVREVLGDFNRRVIEARRQLLGGPPVVTPLRDVEADVAAWHERRDARSAAERREHSEPPPRWQWFPRARRRSR